MAQFNQTALASVDPQSFTSLEEFNQYGFNGPWISNDNILSDNKWVLVNSAGAGITPGLNLTLMMIFLK